MMFCFPRPDVLLGVTDVCVPVSGSSSLCLLDWRPVGLDREGVVAEFVSLSRVLRLLTVGGTGAGPFSSSSFVEA